jgi:hypothetical protein
LAKAIEFIFARVYPKGAFAAFAEFYVFGKLTGVGIEGIAMEDEVVDGVDGRGNSGGSRDLGWRFSSEAAMVAAPVVAAGDGGGAATTTVAGAALAGGEGTGGCGSVSDGFAEGAGVGFVGFAFGFGVGACSGGLACGGFGGAGDGAFGFGGKAGRLLVYVFGGSVGFRFGAGCCGTLTAMTTQGGGSRLGGCRGGKMGCIGARTMFVDVVVARFGGWFGGRSRRWRGGWC